MPRYRPQLATLVEAPPTGPLWLHEIKFDGYRIACTLVGDKVRLESRRNNDWTSKFAELVVAVRQLKVRSALLDGEVAIVGPNGLTSFQALQNAFSGAPRGGLTYFVFDLLHLDGRDLGALPLEERKRQCAMLLSGLGPTSPIRYSQHFESDGASLLAKVCELGGEGIVSKRRDQPYRPGRGDSWQKSKCTKRSEFMIGGFTDPGGSRTGIGALLLGHYVEGVLRFAGKVGTGPGFTAEYLQQVRHELVALEQEACPFTPPPPGWLGRHGHWVRPVRRGEVAFTEWTLDGTLRHPSFQGFRDTSSPVPRMVSRAGLLAPPPPEAAARASAPPRAHGSHSALPGPSGAARVAGIEISSPERLVFPEFTKRELAQFYADIAPWMLRYIANRPLTLVRCAGGVTRQDALRRECQFLPHEAGWYAWASPPIRRAQIQELEKVGEYLVVDTPEALVGLVQGDIIEVHCWNSTLDRLEQPDRVVLDLDPGSGVSWPQIVAATIQMRELLASLGLQCWPKLTGGKGVHVVVPFEPQHGWDAIYALAQRIAQAAFQRDPTTLTLDFAKHKRANRILIDYKRNHRGAVAVAAYSARARPSGAVGIPISWRQLQASSGPDQWTVRNVRQRLRRAKADPWVDFWDCRQRLGP